MADVDRRRILVVGALALTGAATQSATGRSAGRPQIASFALGTTTIPIVGETDVFPVRRIYCIGRNYAARRAKWVPIRRGSRRSSFKSRPTRFRMCAIGWVADHPYPR